MHTNYLHLLIVSDLSHEEPLLALKPTNCIVVSQLTLIKLTKVNEHPPAHQGGWMICEQERLFYCLMDVRM